MNVQPCNKCKCKIKWDPLKEPPMKRDKMGWWVEDLTKLLHTLDRCKNFQNSREFMNESTSIQNAEAHPNIQSAPSPLVKEMDVVDFAEPKMRKEIQVILKNLKVVEDEVIKFLGTDARGDKIGLWMKLVEDMRKK